MKILISGLSSSGKTTLLFKVYLELKNKIKIGGIITPEIREHNKRIGFKCVDLFSGNEIIFASTKFNSGLKFGKYFLEIKEFEKFSINSLNKALQECNLIIIDEIGKMELLSKLFEEKLKEILNSNKNVLASCHRSYLKEYKKFFEKSFWLEKEKFNQVLEIVLKNLNNLR